jgi:hypothetical protein
MHSLVSADAEPCFATNSSLTINADCRAASTAQNRSVLQGAYVLAGRGGDISSMQPAERVLLGTLYGACSPARSPPLTVCLPDCLSHAH